jgi:hypothetical protein
MIGVFSQGCKKENNNTYELNDKLSIFPGNPDAHDEIQIIDKEASSCKTLRIVVSADNIIEYTKRFDSRMLMPCFGYTDTVSIGRLQAGNYTVLYTLIDTAIPTRDSIIETSRHSFRVRGY